MILHLFKKDLRRFWIPLLVGWLLILWQNWAPIGVGTRGKAEQLITYYAANLVDLALCCWIVLLPALVVLEDPLVGTTAFWLSRPLSRRTLLATKSLFVMCFIVLPPLAVQALALATHGVLPGDVARALLELLLAILVFALPAMAIAALSANLIRAVQLFGFLVACFTLVVTGLNFAREIASLHGYYRAYAGGGAFLNLSIYLVGLLWVVVASAAILLAQYATRRTGRLIAAAGLAVIMGIALMFFWNWNFLQPRDSGGPIFTLQAHVSNGRFSPDNASPATSRLFSADVTVGGAPQGWVAGISRLDSCQLISRERKNLPLFNTRPRGVELFGFSTPPTEFLEAALDGMRLYGGASQGNRGRFISFTIPKATFEQNRGQAFTLRMQMTLFARQYVSVCELPLEPGARFVSGSEHLVITDIQKLPESGNVRITLRRFGVRLPLLAPQKEQRFFITPEPDVAYVLLNRTRGEGVIATLDNSSGLRTFVPWGSRFYDRFETQEFGDRMGDSPIGPEMTPEWLADARLVRIELKQSGMVHASPLKIHPFLMEEKPFDGSFPPREEKAPEKPAD